MSQEFDKARQQAEKFLAQGEFAQAAGFFRQAAQIAETAFPAKDQRRCQMLSKLGESLSNQHKFAEAQQVLEQVISLKTEQFGPGNLEVAQALND
ncbi:MAG: tetratricopeptide repeat protein, partial [Candidatus Melainabacteria bacterium]|nr:tetratricopeptide repeat protein [Candidatus Melainabacteria bacterium]